MLNVSAERYINAEFPPWFYAAFTAFKLAAPIKALPFETAAVPDVRPLGIGECLRRVVDSTLLADLKPACAEHFWPQQVAIGIPSGIGLLIFGFRELLELHPDWVLVRIDLRNAYNEIKRASVLRRLNASEDLRCLVPLFHASHVVHSSIYFASSGLEKAEFDSEEGVQQGSGPASAAFCAGIHPEV